MSKVALIMAGFPSAGKSTLLQHCLFLRVPLFGRHSREQDRFAPIPLGTNESDAEYLIGRSYVQLQSAQKLFREQDFVPPDSMMVHVDLSNASSFRDLPYESFRDEEFVFERFRKELLFVTKNYDFVVINTLDVPLNILASQYRARANRSRDKRGWGDSNLDRLYKEQDFVVFETIRKSWKRYSNSIGSYLLETAWKPNFQFVVVEKSKSL